MQDRQKHGWNRRCAAVRDAGPVCKRRTLSHGREVPLRAWRCNPEHSPFVCALRRSTTTLHRLQRRRADIGQLHAGCQHRPARVRFFFSLALKFRAASACVVELWRLEEVEGKTKERQGKKKKKKKKKKKTRSQNSPCPAVLFTDSPPSCLVFRWLSELAPHYYEFAAEMKTSTHPEKRPKLSTVLLERS